MRTLFTIIFLATNLLGGMAQETIRQVIRSIPDNIVPYLNENQREEMATMLETCDTVSVTNAFNGTTTVDSISDDFVRIKLNQVKELQIKLLGVKDSTSTICLVQTISMPIKESVVNFFDTSWTPITPKIDLPDPKDANSLKAMFIQKPNEMDEDTFKELSGYIDPIIIYADVSKAGETITYGVSLPFVNKDKLSEIEAIVKQKTFNLSVSK